MSLGTFLRDARKHARITQAQIASRMNAYYETDVYDQSRVSYWERDERQAPTPDDLKMLAHVYGVKLVDLVIAAGFLSRADIAANAPDVSHQPPEVQEFLALADTLQELQRRFDVLHRKYGQQETETQESNLSGGPP